MDLNAFSDWLVAIKEYFDWYEMIDSEQIWFAKMKLTNSAKMYWQNVLQAMIRLGEPLIGVNHSNIYSVLFMWLCNLNARFTLIFLKITLILNLLMFCKIKREIK